VQFSYFTVYSDIRAQYGPKMITTININYYIFSDFNHFFIPNLQRIEDISTFRSDYID
jgi:hypothetical protein